MNSGAKAALAGFRKQALYILATMLQEADLEREFQPEGEEDLAIYQNGNLSRVVQVKALATPLALSHLNSQKSEEDLFFVRVAALPECTIEVASFGSLGPELQGLRDGDQKHTASVRTKVQEKSKLPGTVVDSILDRFQLKKIEEQVMEREVLDFLGSTVTVGSPQHAFELLTWWMYQASENRTRITFQQLRDRLQSIGRYFAERKAKHQEWFTTIKPLEEVELSSDRRIELAEQYYLGAAARYSHICAGLDVRREELIAEISQKFEAGHNTVILHGASGQGKTSLALRYLHDCVPARWRFQVNSIDNRRHAASVANALADHLHTVDVPVYILLDVAPTDLDWVALVRELLDKPNIRILVAIREEDLARRRASNAELGFPADIALEFRDSEAGSIYQKLVERGDARNPFPSFADAWERFGGEGPLLEFVYLVTQTDSLRTVLAAQVQRLCDEVNQRALPPATLRFLQICAVATAFESRVKLRPLAELLQLPDPSGILSKLEEEYLLRKSADGTTVEALHPFRSILLMELLDDPAFSPTSEIVLSAMSFIPEADLHVFLLYVFSRYPDSADRVIAALPNLSVSTWIGAAGVGKALLWHGMKQYRRQNQEIFDQADELAKGSASFLAVDVAGASEVDLAADIAETLRTMNPEAIERFEPLREQLAPFEDIFTYLADWIANNQIEQAPTTEREWRSYSDLLLWSAKTGIELAWTPSPESIPCEDLPLDTLAGLTAALHRADPDSYQSFMTLRKGDICNRFRKETQTITLREADGELLCDFVVPRVSEDTTSSSQEVDTSVDQINPQPTFDEESLNDRAVHRASLLRMLFPSHDRYCTQGHGHQITHLPMGFELPHDSTYKRMPPEALLLPRLVETNALFRTMDEYHRRPETWRAFAEQILQSREQIVTTLFKLRKNLARYFEKNRPRSIIEGTLSTQEWTRSKELATLPPLPQAAMDEWGLASETNAKQRKGGSPKGSASIASSFALNRHQRFRKATKDYFFAADNFYSQALTVCLCHGQWGRQIERKEEICALFLPHGYSEDKIRLSKFNLFEMLKKLPAMQREFESHLGSLVDADRLDQLQRRESKLFPELWAIWYQFCHQPEQLFHAAGIQSHSAFERAKDQVLAALEAALATRSSQWSAQLLPEQKTWESEPALVIQLDVHHLPTLDEGRSEIVECLQEVLGHLGNGALQQYALEYYWPHVLVIPTWKGKVIENGAWIIPSSLIGGQPDRPWLRILQQIPTNEMEALGFNAQDSYDGKQQREVLSLLSLAGSVYGYFANFTELLSELDDLGKEILLDAFSDPLKEIERCFSRLHDVLPDFIHQSARVCQDNEACGLLIGSLEELLDRLEDLQDGRLDVPIGDAPEEAAYFAELLSNAAILRWIIIAGSVEDVLSAA